MFMQPFIDLLQQNLREPLPGQPAQYRMAPRPRSGQLPYNQSPETARHSGVLILFYPHSSNDSSNGNHSNSNHSNGNHSNHIGCEEREEHNERGKIYLPLILRATYKGVHSGQVGFPGGSWEEGDTDIVATALRETYEEIGVQAKHVQVIGQLSQLYVFASNHLVHPTVAWIDHRPSFRLDAREVAQLIEIPLHELLNPKNTRVEEWQLRDRKAKVPFYSIQGQTIWGATAMMLSELLALPAIAQIAAEHE